MSPSPDVSEDEVLFEGGTSGAAGFTGSVEQASSNIAYVHRLGRRPESQFS